MTTYFSKSFQYRILYLAAAALILGACSHRPDVTGSRDTDLNELVSQARNAVVTVVTYDLNGSVSGIGSGFFITRSGLLVTNLHVIENAYTAEIKTSRGRRYPITSVVSENQQVDLVKLRAVVSTTDIATLPIARRTPAVADPVVVIGSPFGLEQTVSEGIISAIREVPLAGNVYQLTAPISQGSSGGPVLNMQGEAIGVVTFQSSRGQNLNFAVSTKALNLLPASGPEQSISEWTIKRADQGNALAAALCKKGAQLSIQGQFQEALDYYQQAAQANPNDPDAWYGLGSCYLGMNRIEDAGEAYRRPAAADPDNASAHLVLALYYRTFEKYDLALSSLSEVIRIDPDNVSAHFSMGQIFGELDRSDEEIASLQRVLDIEPDHLPAIHQMGLTHGRLGNFPDAVSYLERAVSLEPENAGIHFNLGVTYGRMERTDDAMRAYTRSIQIDPVLVPAHYNLGVAFLEMGKRKAALDQYRILKELDAETAERLFQVIYPISVTD